MAQHEVKFTIPERSLGKKDLEFTVKRNGESFGRLLVSNGTIVWVPRSKTRGFKLGWVKFDKLMQQNGKGNL